MKKIIVILVIIALSAIAVTYALKKPTSVSTVAPSPTSAQQISLTPKQLQQYYAIYKDPYVIHLRKELNGYLDGSNDGISDSNLVIKSNKRDGYIDGLSSFNKDYFKGKFIVYTIENSIAGGKDIAIIFQDKPDKLFNAWVYKLAGGEYDLRGFSQVLNYTPAKMQEIQNKYHVFLSDKNHSL